MNDTEYWEQGTKKLDQMVQAVNGVVSMFPDDLQKKVKVMLDGSMGEAFFMAPASTRRSFHYAFPGGLVAHSLNVVSNTMKIYRALGCLTRWPEWKPAFCALFHDFGKAGDGERQYYIPTKSQWKMDKGEAYELNTSQFFMPSSELGLYVLAKHGIVLEPEMHIAIRLNDGPAAGGNVDYSFLEPDLAVLINMADNWSMRQEKREDGR